MSQYLPQQLSEQEIEGIVRQVIDEVGANGIKEIGKVMAAVMPKIKGRADGAVVNRIVREHLQK